MKRYTALESLAVAIAAAILSLDQSNARSDLQYRPKANNAAFVHRPSTTFFNKPRQSLHMTKCNAQTEASVLFPISKDNYNYIKLNPDDVERTSLQDTHALFGTLMGDGFVERYDVYRRIHNTNNEDTIHSEENNLEIIVVDLAIGHRLNGHDKIVHGGILSLLIDEAMGWASYESLEHHRGDIDITFTPRNTLLVTANLNVDFRSPYLASSKAVLRVFLDREMTSGRKMYLVARLESYDGVVFAEAKSLFLCVPVEKMKGVISSNE
jgi:hypothetical protein